MSVSASSVMTRTLINAFIRRGRKVLLKIILVIMRFVLRMVIWFRCILRYPVESVYFVVIIVRRNGSVVQWLRRLLRLIFRYLLR